MGNVISIDNDKGIAKLKINTEKYVCNESRYKGTSTDHCAPFLPRAISNDH